MKAITLLLLITTVLLTTPLAAQGFGKAPRVEGTVLRIIDGDTFVMSVEATADFEYEEFFGPDSTATVRIIGVDTPEADQPFGEEATEYLARLLPVGSKCLAFELRHDKYPNRVDAMVVSQLGWTGDSTISMSVIEENMTLDSVVNLILLERGIAWCYPCKKESGGYFAEQLARKLGRGLWSASNPIDPADWRKMSKAEKEAALAGR